MRRDVVPVVLLALVCGPRAAQAQALATRDPAAFGTEPQIHEGAAPEVDEDAGPSKKAAWLKDKAARHPVRARRPPRAGAEPVLTLHNLWTGEVLAVPRQEPSPVTWNQFLRCHHTNQTIEMDRRLLPLLRAAARRFSSQLIEVVSGFRAPKYNLFLRKKGHQVARDSQHTLGHAVDFRVIGAPIAALRRFVAAHRLGGVGYYPHSQFIHADTGPVRSWTAE